MQLPLTFDPVSNGEYLPRPKSERDARAEAIARSLAEEGARRSGRRDFLRTSCAMAACLAGINAASPVPAYALPTDATLDPAAADAALGGDEFIFDIQTHHVMPGQPWEKSNPAMKTFLKFLPGKTDFSRYAYVKEMFLDSDTTCAVLSAVPATAEGQPLSDKEAAGTREIVDSLGKSPRLQVHALVTPNLGEVKASLDGMEKVAKEFKIAAWKVYTLFGPKGEGYWLDDEKVGLPMIEKAREIGIKLICTHKGIPLFGTKGDHHLPTEIGRVAKKYPDVKFIVYHSGFDPDVKEGPYDPDKAGRGVNALLKAVEEAGLKPGSNVYAELGSTWWLLMKKPEQATHVIGKLLKHVGEQNVVWGSDSIWYGTPQPQIQAFRAFEMSKELCEKHGYPELTKERKAKIFGLNAAAAYGVDPKIARPAIEKDGVEKLKQSYLPKREPSYHVYGPRTRREFFALLASRGGMPA